MKKNVKLWIRFVKIGIFLVLVLGVAVCIGVPQSIYAAKMSAFPEAWYEIQPGMTSDEARVILGEPWADGRGLKSVDRWYLEENGVAMHLDLLFKRDSRGDDATVMVVWRYKQVGGKEVERVDLGEWD